MIQNSDVVRMNSSLDTWFLVLLFSLEHRKSTSLIARVLLASRNCLRI